jgi:hypothetical protein
MTLSSAGVGPAGAAGAASCANKAPLKASPSKTGSAHDPRTPMIFVDITTLLLKALPSDFLTNAKVTSEHRPGVVAGQDTTMKDTLVDSLKQKQSENFDIPPKKFL